VTCETQLVRRIQETGSALHAKAIQALKGVPVKYDVRRVAEQFPICIHFDNPGRRMARIFECVELTTDL
jgi:hypothetical protein